MRLIDADALLSELREELEFDTPMYTEEQNRYVNSGLRIAIKDVKSAPTVDIKTEVAREIFAEIEELKNIIKLSLNSKELQGLEKPINSMIRDSIDLILLELKNKYTKEGVGE